MLSDTATGWRGVFAYLPTATDERGRPDEAALRSLVDHVIDRGVSGVTPLGGSGEYPLVDPADRQRIIANVTDQSAGRVPVIAGVGGFTAAQVIAEMERAAEVGADGYLCILQGYYRMTPAQVLDSYARIAAASDRPIVVYHNPGQCHITLTDDVVAAFSKIEHLDYVKDASGLASNLANWTAFADGPAYFSGTAGSIAAAMMLGAVGWMSGPATVLPTECAALYDLCMKGDWQRAARLERALTPLLDAFRRHGQPVTIKTALAARGRGVGEPLLPIQAPSAAEGAWIVEQVGRAERDARAILDQDPDERTLP